MKNYYKTVTTGIKKRWVGSSPNAEMDGMLATPTPAFYTFERIAPQ